MSNAAALLQSYPGTMNLDKGLLATAIDEALTCFQTCTAGADARLSKEMIAELGDLLGRPRVPPY